MFLNCPQVYWIETVRAGSGSQIMKSAQKKEPYYSALYLENDALNC
jgi:hypothetical protein